MLFSCYYVRGLVVSAQLQILAQAHAHTHTNSLSFSLSGTHILTNTHTHTHACTHTHTLSLTHSLTRSKHKCWHSSTFMVWVNMCTVTSRKHVFDLVKIAIPFHDGKFGRYMKSGTVASSNQRFIQKEKAVLFSLARH